MTKNLAASPQKKLPTLENSMFWLHFVEQKWCPKKDEKKIFFENFLTKIKQCIVCFCTQFDPIYPINMTHRCTDSRREHLRSFWKEHDFHFCLNLIFFCLRDFFLALCFFELSQTSFGTENLLAHLRKAK